MTARFTAYVGGPMTNRPGFNFEAFDSLSGWLEEVQGWQVHNPHAHDQEMYPGIDNAAATQIGDVVGIAEEVGFSFKQAMSWDLARVAESDHMVLLPEWESSTGAKAERFVAEMTGTRIWLAWPVPYPGAGWTITLDAEQKRLTPPVLDKPTTPITALDNQRHEFTRDLEHVRGAMGRVPLPEERSAERALMEGLPLMRADTGVAPQIGQFQTKDSGVREEFHSGMVRDTQEGKPRYDLIPLAPLKRMAELYARGAQKYGDRNWEKATGSEELERFKASGLRHFYQALMGDRDEDHWAGAVFNIFGAMWLEERLSTVSSVMETD